MMCYSPVYMDSDHLYRVGKSAPGYGIEMVPLASGVNGVGSLFVPSGVITEGSATAWLKKYAREQKLKKWRGALA